MKTIIHPALTGFTKVRPNANFNSVSKNLNHSISTMKSLKTLPVYPILFNRKYILTLFVLLIFYTNLSAKNYYFSSISGNDNYTFTQAQNSSTPWKSINKVNAVFNTVLPGDSILFKRGESFFGSISVIASGALNRHIVIGAYGTGANPILSGFSTVSSWSLSSAGIYQSIISYTGTKLNLVTINNKPVRLGRFPNDDAANGGYLHYQTSDSLSITDSNFSRVSSVNWAGAEVVIRKRLWVLDRCIITSRQGNTIRYANIDGIEVTGTPNYGYFIQNDIRTLDQQGEWHFNYSTKMLKIYFGSNNPNTYAVKTATIDNLINILNQRYITIRDLNFEGCNEFAINNTIGNYISVIGCEFNNIGNTAINIKTASNIFIDNIVTNTVLNNAVKISASYDSNFTVKNCLIKNTATLRGMGQSTANAYKAFFIDGKKNVTIENNKIDTTGFTGIDFEGSNVIVKNNVVNYFCFVKDDGGGIYTYFPIAVGVPTKRIIRDNIIMNGIGAPEGRSSSNLYVSGIYLDGLIANVDVINNTIFDIKRYGIHCNNATNVNITGNTVYNTPAAMDFARWTWGSITNLNIKKNIFYAKTSNQKNIHYTNEGIDIPTLTTLQNAIRTIGVIDSNYYSLPNETGFTYEIYKTAAHIFQATSPQSFDAWKSFSGHDAHSKRAFREAPECLIRSLTSANKVVNSTFNTDISSIISYGENTTVTWDNTNKIAGGSVKISFSAPTANKYTLVYAAVGAISSTKKYVLRFQTLGTTANGIARVYLKKTAAPYNELSQIYFKSFGVSLKRHEVVFDAPVTDANASYLISIEQNSGTTYIDNVEFYEADAAIYNIDDYLRLEYNPTNVPITINLGAKYVGVDSAFYNGSITLAPFTSKVLLKDTSVLRQSLTVQATSTSIKCNGGTAPVVVTATGGVQPYWGIGTFNAAAGTYTYTVKDLWGNVASKTITVTQPTPIVITLIASPITTFGGTATVKVLASGGTPPYIGIGKFTNITTGTRTFTVRDANGCAVSKTITISNPIVRKSSSSGKIDVNELNEELSVNVYPNPTKNGFDVAISNTTDITDVMVTSVEGRIVYSNNANNLQRFHFGDNLKPGLYILTVRRGNDKRTMKLIKTN